jgi:N-acetylmuramoyl-L-alanine amidase
MRQIRNIVIHCTATAQTTTVASIQRHWRNVLKWKNPGYHLIILPDGSFQRLAPDEAICNGVAGHNSNSIHISYIGGVDSKNNPIDNRTDAQKKTMLTLITTMQARYPNARVLGHRDFPNVRKACPSFDVMAWLNSL